MIKVCNRNEIESLIGEATIANKIVENGHIEILCDDHYPVTLKYNTNTNYMTFIMDYSTQIAGADDLTGFHSYKPGLNLSKDIILKKK
jgi:membrane-bound lytic murein transglycosylase B